MLPNGMDLLCAKIRRLVFRCGGENAIRGLARAMCLDEQDSAQTLTRAEVAGVFSSLSINLDAREMDMLMKHFDINGDGQLGVAEFITALRGSMSPQRKSWSNKVWMALPKAGGRVALAALHRAYNAAAHPDVQAGRRTEEDVEARLQETFNGSTNPSGMVTKEDFECWCAGVSAGIDSDEYFVLLMNNCWGLAPPKRTTNSFSTMSAAYGLDGSLKLPLLHTAEDKLMIISGLNRNDRMAELISLIRLHVLERPCGIRGLGRVYRSLDMDNQGFLRLDDFLEGSSVYQLPISEEDLMLLVEAFDSDGDGTVNYDEFLLQLRGHLEPRRKKVIERAFQRFDADNNGVADAAEICRRFQVNMNPVVVKGKRTADEVLNDFQAAFDQGPVTYEDFEEYWTGVSTLVKNDKHFEIMIQHAWK
uniref:EF-hand domain-containing protein n=1 Tax=Eutreptiella gymnastica TaxID=73025 RepID=A0A7S1IRI4_9EUGL